MQFLKDLSEHKSSQLFFWLETWSVPTFFESLLLQLVLVLVL
jgi:hypothetical protein